jgi:DnaD/phage-associated family protein
MRLNSLWSAEGRIKSAFGIRDRALVQNERKYIPVWLEDYGFDIPLIQLAYERCVVATGKLSFSYINGILTNWHKNGINTPKAALKAMKDDSFNKRAETKTSSASASYDMAEIEKMLDKVTF